ncbi:MAG TPA: response regulator transcription factor [Dermatophilaceae bacterium]|nr:response regulator transcription factor [Dermatophilaceae bacterium]
MIRVLLVDDQPIVRAGLRTLLGVESDIGIVGEAGNGRDAVRLTLDLRPDVVLMDVRMPGIDGIEATKQIMRSGLRTRVCVLTTYSVDDYVIDALAAGASGFLLKTDAPDRILATIRAVAQGQFSLGAEATAALVARSLAAAPVARASADVLAGLTARERQVFELIAGGLSNAEIAQRLVVGEGTVKTHVARILMKLGLRDRIQVVVFAHRNGLAG